MRRAAPDRAWTATLPGIRAAFRMRGRHRGGGPAPAALRSAWTRVGGLRVHARVSAPAADRPPVVLVHGWGISSRYMIPIGTRLADEFTAYVPDLPGHGESDRTPRALDVAELAEALVAWMDAVGLDRVPLLGHSLGCQIVAEVAARRPERVQRAVLVGPTADPAARTVPMQAARYALSIPAERPSLVAVCTLDYARMGPRRLWSELRHMIEHRIEDLLPALRLPVLVVRGGRDAMVSQCWAETVVRLAGAEGPVVVPGWGHALVYSAARELDLVVRPFLREGRTGPAIRPPGP